MSDPTRVIIVADVRLYREGIARALSERPEFDVVGTATSLGATLDLLRQTSLHVILVDMAMADGLTVLRALADTQGAGVVAFAIDEAEDDVVACAEAGVVAFVPRSASLDDLVSVLNGVRQGELICSPGIASKLLRNVGRRYREAGSVVKPLVTPREKQVWNLLERGLSNKEIATELSIGVATAKNHVHNLLAKLPASSRVEAAALRHSTVRSIHTRPTSLRAT